MMRANNQSLLVELGTEELPPKALDELGRAFAAAVCEGLSKRGIGADINGARSYVSPRRLAVLIPHVADAQPDQLQERRGPALAAATDAAGQPTKAVTGFALSCGVEVAQLEKLETDKGTWFVYRASKPGQATAALVPEIIHDALKALPIPRAMRWGAHEYTFVRPAHWLVVLHGADVINAQVLGLTSGRKSRGHRFHHPEAIDIKHADSWLAQLRDAKVLADPAERRERIRSEVMHVAAQTGGAPRLGGVLLDEIANLTEWPIAIACRFERQFLSVPAEALVMTMETNQKFVPVFSSNGSLSEHFVGIANIQSKQPDEIRRGYERVIRPRFADAKYFYSEDLKTKLADHQSALKAIVYQHSLGSVWDKSVRVADLARVIANRVGVDAALATRAASLSKCDLLTRMVGEFPELQGVMGRYYAVADGETAAVANALDTFYAPRFAGDEIAPDDVGRVLAVAERIDTLAGIFAVGQKPSGNKDPFALRRAALGLARTLIEGAMNLDLRALLTEAMQLLPDAALSAGLPKSKDGGVATLDAGARRDALVTEVHAFIIDRLRSYYADRGVGSEIFESVRVMLPSELTDFDARLRAVVAFAQLPQAQALSAANKRIGNILRQAGDSIASAINSARLESGAEAQLFLAVENATRIVAPLNAQRQYIEILQTLAALRDPVDDFFDQVMVMVDDVDLRRNRLALLQRVHRMFLDVADISLLPTAAA